MKVNWLVLAGAAIIALGALPWLNHPRALDLQLLPASLLMSAILAAHVSLPRSRGRAAAMIAVAVAGTCIRTLLAIAADFLGPLGCTLGLASAERCAQLLRPMQVLYEALCYASTVGSVLVVVGSALELTQLQRRQQVMAEASAAEGEGLGAGG